MTRLVYDYDPVIFKACCAVELRQIKCTNTQNKEEHIFKSRTEFYGNWRKKNEGWLAEQAKGGSTFTVEDYTIEDFRTVEPLENALVIIKNKINSINELLGADSYFGFVGGHTNFRKELCTLLPYKGQRKTSELPQHLDEAKKYILSYHNAQVAQGHEVDDAVVTAMHSARSMRTPLIGVIAEKDFLGCDGDWYNFDQIKMYNVRGFGGLERTDKGIKGTGRMWKYFQAAWSDKSDNYEAACFSDERNGEVQVYNRLSPCSNDREAFTALVAHFKHLYPVQKPIVNWKGDTVLIDWLYVLQECFNMAHLERWKGDRINVKEVLDKLKIEY